jgi:hypothetical protein
VPNTIFDRLAAGRPAPIDEKPNQPDYTQRMLDFVLTMAARIHRRNGSDDLRTPAQTECGGDAQNSLDPRKPRLVDKNSNATERPTPLEDHPTTPHRPPEIRPQPESRISEKLLGKLLKPDDGMAARGEGAADRDAGDRTPAQRVG